MISGTLYVLAGSVHAIGGDLESLLEIEYLNNSQIMCFGEYL